jgi:hypothetical protein
MSEIYYDTNERLLTNHNIHLIKLYPDPTSEKWKWKLITNDIEITSSYLHERKILEILHDKFPDKFPVNENIVEELLKLFPFSYSDNFNIECIIKEHNKRIEMLNNVHQSDNFRYISTEAKNSCFNYIRDNWKNNLSLIRHCLITPASVLSEEFSGGLLLIVPNDNKTHIIFNRDGFIRHSENL